MPREHVFFSGEYAVSDPFIDLESGQIPAMFLLDSNTLYGDGVFEGIRIYNGRIFKLAEHLDRLWSSAAYLEIELPYTKRELTEILRSLCRKNGIAGTGYIRLVATRGHRKDLGINTRMVYKPTVFIIARSLQLYPKELYDKGLSVIIAKVRRTPPSSCSPNVKTCNYVNNILAVIEGNRAEVPEVIMLTVDGKVCECSADNVFIVKDGVVLTPPTENILMGVTRTIILQLCGRLEIPARESEFGPEEVYAADEVFLTGSGAEVAPIVSVDSRAIADGKPGPLTRKLLREFRSVVNDPANSVPVFD